MAVKPAALYSERIQISSGSGINTPVGLLTMSLLFTIDSGSRDAIFIEFSVEGSEIPSLLKFLRNLFTGILRGKFK